MIGTIRKHSKWLWVIIITATVISFVFWGTNVGRQDAGGRGSGNFGSINGRKITQDAYLNARNEIYLQYFFNSGGEWPNKNPNVSAEDLERQTYARLMLLQKAGDMGINVSDDAAGRVAAEILRSFGRSGTTLRFDVFVKQVLQPEGLTAEDFQHFARNDLVIQQLIQVMGLPGQLITPQEAAVIYQRERQELSAQIVFFSASNYLSQVAVTPAAVAQFYTNYLPAYRLPDRVQVSYVAFGVSNHLAQAEAKLVKTNLDEIIEANYRRLGADYFHDAKTPAEARAKIRETLIRREALVEAHKEATEFANDVFNQEPARPENFAAVAKQKGLAVHVTAPFAGDYGPAELGPVEGFTKAAFALTPEEPFARPIISPDAIYLMVLLKRLPSEIPPFDQIRDRVTADYQYRQAMLLAQRAGTNFVRTLTSAMAGGQGFASICTAAGLHPILLPPFSLSTRELPALGNLVSLSQLQEAAFSTPVGKTSDFQGTGDGGFVVYAQSRLPLDQAVMNTDLPQFISALRNRRQKEAFDSWLQREANKELRDTPLYHRQASAGTAK